ncbi:MAG: di-heme oxidoredictase family protein [Myxococcota bacterium]|nr:di-heme oxidoredictase family protein [Myxococcota bacterium]
MAYVRWSAIWFALACMGSACGDTDPEDPIGSTNDGAPTDPFEKHRVVEEGEAFPGDVATNTLLLGPNAFLPPAENLSVENDIAFYSGNGFFNLGWVAAPASTTARDGLGPVFNARSCSGCHTRDGRAAPPEAGPGPFVGLLLRVSVPTDDGPMPHPIYGGQIQDNANPDIPIEATPVVEWKTFEGQYDDGTQYTLVAPVFTLTALNYGPIADTVMLSPRFAPHLIGLGLLDGITEQRLAELADPDDRNGDGISGRIQWHIVDGQRTVGRFGWKAETTSVEQQVAEAFAGDMGLTSRLFPHDDCTRAQNACNEAANGGVPEVDDDVFERVVIYSRAVAVPVRRQPDNDTILAGKVLFHKLGCAHCHVPSHLTANAPLDEFSNLKIWPYTDLLLHDMGEGLADDRPVSEASGREWRTPPLWGVGLFQQVSGHTRYLHDGRARNIAEAILWHGGEAERARDGFKALSKTDRDALVKFVEDL